MKTCFSNSSLKKILTEKSLKMKEVREIISKIQSLDYYSIHILNPPPSLQGKKESEKEII